MIPATTCRSGPVGAAPRPRSEAAAEGCKKTTYVKQPQQWSRSKDRSYDRAYDRSYDRSYGRSYRNLGMYHRAIRPVMLIVIVYGTAMTTIRP